MPVPTRRIRCFFRINSLFSGLVFLFRPDREFARKALELRRVSAPQVASGGPETKNSLLFCLYIESRLRQLTSRAARSRPQPSPRRRAGGTPALPGSHSPARRPPQNSGRCAPHFALMRASISRLDRATTGNVLRRANGLQASMTTRELRRSVSPS
jgi:hypothetical protein